MKQELENLSFESALGELESIINRLENSDTPLEEAIELYQRGNLLKQHCEKTLREATARIQQITLDAQDKPTGVEETTL